MHTTTGDLPATEIEGKKILELIEKLNKRINGEIRTEHHIGKTITKSLIAIDILYRSECHILHYSGHCYFDDKDTSQCGWILDKENRLKVSEIASISGNPIIFNNACSTALQSEKKSFYGRGLIEGLAYDFVKKGAVAYIGTLWPIEDDLAMEIAVLFYQNFLERGLTLGESLQLAKREVFEENNELNFSSLGYILSGDPLFNLHQVIEEQNRIQCISRNEKAIDDVIKFEREYTSLEIDCFNDPHWIFWTTKYWTEWVNDTLNESGEDINNFTQIFEEYKQYFRNLTIGNKKIYKIILNFNTIKKFLVFHNPQERSDFLNDLLNFLKLPNFNLIFYLGQKEELEEYEILSKNTDENQCLADNLAIEMRQPRIRNDRIFTYFLFENDQAVVRRYMRKYEADKLICLQHYRDRFSTIFSFLYEKDIHSLSEDEIKTITTYIIKDMLVH